MPYLQAMHNITTLGADAHCSVSTFTSFFPSCLLFFATLLYLIYRHLHVFKVFGRAPIPQSLLFHLYSFLSVSTVVTHHCCLSLLPFWYSQVLAVPPLISAYTIITHAPPNAKKAKISVSKCKVKKLKEDPGRMVVLVHKKTRRGKIIFVKEDTAPYYASSDEGKSPEKKPSVARSCSRTAVPAPPEDAFQPGASCSDNKEPIVTRVTKIRLRFQYIIEV
jgi:hypothetical protein